MSTAADIVGPSPWQQERRPIEEAWFERAWQGQPDTHVYRHFDAAGRLLYVGITSNPNRREQGHKQKSPWWPSVARVEITPAMPRAMALTAEWVAINDEAPVWNHQRENGYTGPGSRVWLEAEAVEFRRRMAEDPELWEREMDHVRAVMDQMLSDQHRSAS